MTPGFSLSKSALALSGCTAWLSNLRRETVKDTNDACNRGNAFHDVMDMWIKVECGGKPIGSYPRSFASLSSADKDKVNVWVRHAQAWMRSSSGPVPSRALASEVFVRVDFTNGIAATDASVVNRNYPDLPGYECGTADVVGTIDHEILGRRSFVGDWKTGMGEGAREQLLSLAYALSRLDPPGIHDWAIGTLFVGDDGVGARIEGISREQLEAHGKQMSEALRSGAGRPERPGVHCHALYCPSAATCPSVGSVVTESIKGTPGSFWGDQQLVDLPLSDEEAGRVMSMVTAAKRSLAVYEQGVRDWCTSGGRAYLGDKEFLKTNRGFTWVTRK